jgi:hypothetical protein
VSLPRKSNAAVQNRSIAWLSLANIPCDGRHTTKGIAINAAIARLIL